MARPSRAAEAVTAVAYAAMSASFPSDPLTPVLGAMQSVVGADVAGFYTHEWRGWTTAVRLTPAAAWRIVPFDRLPTSLAIGVHPGVAHLVGSRPTQAFAVTDVVSERVWASSPLFAVMRPDWGRNQQFALPVPPRPGEAVSQVFVLGRMSGAFSSPDREVGEALLPVLAAVARHWDALAATKPSEAVSQVLTARELAVLGLLADGLRADGVALRLGMATRTVQKHLERVYRKLDVHSGSDAVRLYQYGPDSPPLVEPSAVGGRLGVAWRER